MTNGGNRRRRLPVSIRHAYYNYYNSLLLSNVEVMIRVFEPVPESMFGTPRLNTFMCHYLIGFFEHLMCVCTIYSAYAASLCTQRIT